MVCLVTICSPYFLFPKKKKIIFETKKLVWQPKIDRKQKLFSKLKETENIQKTIFSF